MAISLEKGQRISLTKGIKKVQMGLRWTPIKKGLLGKIFGVSETVDLDASCLIFDADKELIDTVYFGKLWSDDGAIKHSGDDLTGQDNISGVEDNEVINVDLSKLSDEVQYLVFTVSSYKGQMFDIIQDASCRLLDDNSNEVANYTIAGGGHYTGMIMAKVYKHNDEWKVQAIGESTNATTPRHLTEPCRSIL